MSAIFNVTVDVDEKEYRQWFNFPTPYIPHFRGKILVDNDGVVWGYSEECKQVKYAKENLEGDNAVSILFGALAGYDQDRFGVMFVKRTCPWGCGFCFLPNIEDPNVGMWFRWGLYTQSVMAKVVFKQQPFSEEEAEAIMERFRNRFLNDRKLVESSIKFIDHEYVADFEDIIGRFEGKFFYTEYSEQLLGEWTQAIGKPGGPRSVGLFKRVEEKLVGERDLFDLGYEIT